MYILAIETSSRIGSVAAGIDEKITFEAGFTATAKHGAELIPKIDKAIKYLNITPREIDIVCISAGPGSFTGLRVGFSFARTYAQITGAKLIKVPSTDVIVKNIDDLLSKENKTIYIAPVIDAKRNMIFSSCYKWNGKLLSKIIDDHLTIPDKLISSITEKIDPQQRESTTIWILGEGLDFHRTTFEQIMKRYNPKEIEHVSENNFKSNTKPHTRPIEIKLIDRDRWLPKAHNVYRLALNHIKEERFVPLEECLPNYLRLSDAEEKLLARKREKSNAEKNKTT